MSKESNKKKDVKKKNSTIKKEVEKKDKTFEEVVEKDKKNTNKKEESKANKSEKKKSVELVEEIEEIEEVEIDEDVDFEEEEFDDEEIEDDEEVENEEEFEDDEDIEDDIEEDEEEEKNDDTVKIKLVEDKKKAEKISQIEKKVKLKKKRKKVNFDNVIDFLERNHLIIYGMIAGVLVTTLVAFIIWPDRIAALKNGEEPIVKVGKKNYTADYLYEVMKDNYSVSLLLNEIDKDLLNKMYPETDEMNEEVESNANYYFDTYKQYYGYTQEQFLEQNGFANLEEFYDYLRLDYRRNKYLDDYIKDGIDDKEIDKYYKKNVFGDINTQHILIEVSSSEDDGKLSDEDAKTKAEEIIDKLNDGTSWEDIQKKYEDDITFEDLSYQSWDASLEKSFMDALVDMEDNSYSEEPVKTSYGYHIIYRLDQKKTPKLKDVKETIIENMVADEKADDADLLNKALISLREEKKIDFKDTVMKEKYEEYCKSFKK